MADAGAKRVHEERTATGEDIDSDDDIRPTKAYKSSGFIASREARTVRVVCEFEEALQRLRDHSVRETIVFFGSSIAKSHAQHKKEMAKLEKALAEADNDEKKNETNEAIAHLNAIKWMCDEYDKVVELSRRLTEFAMAVKSAPVAGGGYLSTANEKSGKRQTMMICTGGGHGMMEAANRGAAQVPGAKSIGMGISLPESNRGVNAFVTKELAFEFHYFFTRKYWLLYPCRALIVPPGGFATLDALFELLTLKQTGKIKIDIPVVMLGVQYWHELIDFKALVKFGTISQGDLDSLFFTDSVDDAYAYVTKRITELRDKDRELFYSRKNK